MISTFDGHAVFRLVSLLRLDYRSGYCLLSEFLSFFPVWWTHSLYFKYQLHAGLGLGKIRCLHICCTNSDSKETLEIPERDIIENVVSLTMPTTNISLTFQLKIAVQHTRGSSKLNHNDVSVVKIKRRLPRIKAAAFKVLQNTG